MYNLCVLCCCRGLVFWKNTLNKSWFLFGFWSFWEMSSCTAMFLVFGRNTVTSICGGVFLACILWCILFLLPFFSTSLTLLSSSSLTQTNSLLKGSRRRQKGSDYTSTSDDDEYDSQQGTPKNKCSQPPSAFHSPRSQPRPRPQPMVALHPKHSSKDSEENKPEGETLHNWSNHSAEIAR